MAQSPPAMELGNPPKLGEDELSQDEINDLRRLGINNLYFFSRGILRYTDLVPRVHRMMCDFVVDHPARRKLLLAPRSHFKTTIGLANLLRMVCADPNKRILLANESARNAEAMLFQIKQHILHNTLLRQVYSYIIPRDVNDRKTAVWNQEEILLPRQLIASEPTIQTIGVGGAVVSRHFDHLDFDDLIGEEALLSPTVMQRAVSWLNHSVSLLTRPDIDTMHMRGTRWAYNDLYAHAMTNMGFETMRIKAVVYNPDNGEVEPLFKERFSLEFFAGIMQADPNQWAAQYANDPSDVAFADFQKSWLRYYNVAADGHIRWTDIDGTVHKQDMDKLQIYIHVDPSVGENPSSDSQAVMTVGVNAEGQSFVLDAWQRRVDPMQLIDKLFDLHERFSPKLISIEATAFQKSLHYYIDKESKRRGTYLRIEDYKPSTRKTKEARIRGALQPYFSSGQVFVRPTQIDFIEQYLAFGRTDDDHMMDALAQGPQYWRSPRHDPGYKKLTANSTKILVGSNRYGLGGYGIGVGLN